MGTKRYKGYSLVNVGLSWYVTRAEDSKAQHVGLSLAEAKRTIDAGLSKYGWHAFVVRDGRTIARASEGR